MGLSFFHLQGEFTNALLIHCGVFLSLICKVNLLILYLFIVGLSFSHLQGQFSCIWTMRTMHSSHFRVFLCFISMWCDLFRTMGAIHGSMFIWDLSFIAMWMKEEGLGFTFIAMWTNEGFPTMWTNPCRQAITSRSFYVPIGNLVLHSQSSRMSFTTLWCKYNNRILLKFSIVSDSFESYTSQTKTKLF